MAFAMWKHTPRPSQSLICSSIYFKLILQKKVHSKNVEIRRPLPEKIFEHAPNLKVFKVLISGSNVWLLCFKLTKNKQIFIILAAYYEEARDEWRDPSPRHSAWTT